MYVQGFDAAAEADNAFRMSSFAEPAALGYLKSQVGPFEWNGCKVCRTNFPHSFPLGHRVR